MIVHNGFKILSDMPKLVFYLFENFRGELMLSGIWPKNTSVEVIMYFFEWYSTKLRPFMWEFYGIMASTSKAGLTNFNALQEGSEFSLDQESEFRNGQLRSENDLEKLSQSNQQLQKIHDEYMTRFKFICEQMEAKFFKNPQATPPKPFILDNAEPTCLDYLFYQEMVSAMILSGNGT
mmetsp:Transcript_3163/g.5280  ORF Transcript_3163/g.5280 Transcript_3163/m.5280 type:complete len:178 (+) Transcript_3163:276-809(+)